jgi:hypothetical protein
MEVFNNYSFRGGRESLSGSFVVQEYILESCASVIC